jgi:hypothetical protein
VLLRYDRGMIWGMSITGEIGRRWVTDNTAKVL